MNGSRVTLAFVSQNIRSSQIAYCYTGGLINARRGMTVPRKSLARCNARHLRIKLLVQFIFVDPVYYNVLTTCAALLCRACLDEITCVAERYLTLRTGCSRGRTPKVVRPQQRKNPLPFPCFAAVTCRQSAPDSPRERGENQRVETAGVYPLVPPPGRRPPAEVQRKHPAR